MKIKISFEKNSPDFKKLSRKEQHPEKRVRLLALGLLKEGKTMIQTGKILGASRITVGKWYQRWKKHGLEGLDTAHRSGRPAKIPLEKKDEFIQAVADLQESRCGGSITAHDISQMACEKFGVKFAKNAIYPVLYRFKLSWTSARSKHPKSDLKKQACFKKTFNNHVQL